VPYRRLCQTAHSIIIVGRAVTFLDKIPGRIETMGGEIFMGGLNVEIRILRHLSSLAAIAQ
jgi:hypothetical protein